MQEEKVLLPELRFPEFEGEWVEKKLFEIAKIERGRFSPRPRNNPIYYNGEIPFVQTGDVVNSNGIIENYTQTLNQKGLKVSKLFPKGTILITIAANIGYAGVLAIDMACPDSLIGIKCKKNIFNIFLNYQLELEQPKMDYLAVAAAQKNINIEFLKPYKFIIADLKEQQKIANFLTAIDNRIQTLEKKKTLLEQYKKGVMQKIFKQELRFKDDTSTSLSKSDGKAFPEWGEKKLVNILTEFNEKSVISNQHPILSSTTKGLFKQSDYFTRDIASKDNTGYKILRKQQLVFSPQNLWLGNINVNCDFEVGIVSPSYKVFDFNKNLTSFIYCKYLLFTNRMFYEYAQASEQGASVVRRNLDMSSFKAIPIKLPSKEEQTKIANFLSSIDKNIALVAKKIEHTKTYKKGLLQQMFV